MNSSIMHLNRQNPVYRLASALKNWMLKKARTGYWEKDMLLAYSELKGNIKFIQIGSNDGMHGDPLCHYINKNKWEGILVEPVPYLFEKLKKNYADSASNLIFENKAIADINGELPFYRLKKSDLHNLPEWYDQLGSFKKDVLFKHRDHIPNFDELVIEDSVKTITFSDLIAKHNFTTIDLIHIDTEGYDFEILKLIPFDQLNIEFIMFEYKHLSSSDFEEAKKLLKKFGYKVRRKDNSDAIGIKSQVLKR
jgi:FkbM family methyltransferase